MSDERLPPYGTDDEVVAAVDEDGDRESFVLADLTSDEAWISMEVTEAAVLPAWR